MIHLPPLIQDLSLILISAGIVSVLFRKIGQPVVLGYIIAGFLISSRLWFLPNVSDLPNIQVWAEIGVIFLLFSLGLEFSFKKLVKVGGPASVTALIEIIGMLGIGYLSGKFFGWNTIDSLFLGGILAISSTTIIIKTIHETGMKGRGFVDFIFAILIIEDLGAVLLLVILSTVALTSQISEGGILFIAMKLLFFIALCFLSGTFFIPTLLKSMRKILNEEMLLITSIAFCFLSVVLSTEAGFSPGLGAFIIGAILGGTNEGKKIDHLLFPLKDLFGAIFFVSVGMLLNPQILIKHTGPVLLLTVVTIFGKFFTIFIGSFLSKRSFRHSVQSGLSMAQIGEFSFIIAALGMSLKVTSSFLYPIAVGVSVLTTFITPYLIRNIDPIYLWVEKFLPRQPGAFIKKNVLKPHTTKGEKELLKHYLYQTFGIILINCIIVASITYLIDWVFPHRMQFIERVLSILTTAPFLAAILDRKVDYTTNEKTKKRLTSFVEATRKVIFFALCSALLYRHSKSLLVIGVSILITILIIFLFSKKLKIIYDYFESHFIKNLFEEDMVNSAPSFGPWDAHISYLIIPAESEVAGKTLHELKIRESFGASIALIERGHLFITAPGRDEKLFPNDRVAVIGNDDSISRLTHYLKTTKVFTPNTKVENYALHKIVVKESMPFAFKTIRKSGIREKTDGLVVGIERHGEKILNPDSMLKILPDDLLWIVGDSSKLDSLS